MKQNPKQFILKTLIPFILREQGRGFAMGIWLDRWKKGSLVEEDGLLRKVPSCGSVACIGGSVQVLTKTYTLEQQAAALGITPDAADRLFYRYEHWPSDFSPRYRKASTPYRKAQVACALLRETVRTKGRCMEWR